MERYDDTGETQDATDRPVGSDEHHATTGGAAAAGAITAGVVGLAGGPVGAAIGVVGGAIVGAAAERVMHANDRDPYPPTAAAPIERTDPSTVTDATPVPEDPLFRPDA